MKKHVLVAVVVLAFVAGKTWGYSATVFRAMFAPQYAAAEEMAKGVYVRLYARLGNAELARIGTAVVFPELCRYSYIEDVAETSALEIDYVLGLGADFSIGKLQMKPSFAETIEHLAGKDLRARFPWLTSLPPEGRAARAERLQRLKSEDGEADYLALFLLIMTRRFPATTHGGVAAVRLLAAAYNGGVQLSRAELNAVASSCEFPYGRRYKGEQFCYTDIAVMYYNEEKAQ